MPTPVKNNISQTPINQNIPPYPYVMSLRKLFIMSFLTFGIFEVYWFYRQWKSFSTVTDKKHGRFVLLLLALFAGFSSFSLFKKIENEVKTIDPTFILKPYGLASAYFLINILYKLPDPYWLLSLLSVLALLPVQKAINDYWEKKCGEKVVRSEFGKGNIIALIIGIIVLLLDIIGMFSNNS